MFFQLLELFLGRLRRNVVDESSGPLGMSRRGGYFHRIERINASSVSMVSTARNSSMSVVHGQHSTDGRGIVLTMTVGTVRTVRCIRRLGLTRNRWDRWNRHGCHDMGRVGDVDCRMRVARTATSMTGMAVRVGSPGVAGRRCSNRSGSGMGRLGGIHRLEAVELTSGLGNVQSGWVLLGAFLLAFSSVGSCRGSDGPENALHVFADDVATRLGIFDEGLALLINPILGGDVPLDLALHAGIPVVLDGIVGTSRKELGNLGPLVAETLVMGDDETVLLLTPGHLADGRVEMVVPTLAALLSDAAGEFGSDLTPTLGSMSLDEAHNLFIFLLRPRTLEGTGLLSSADAGNLVVSPHALGRLATVADHTGNLGPIQIANLVPLQLRGIPAVRVELVGIVRRRRLLLALLAIAGVEGLDGLHEVLVLLSFVGIGVGGRKMKRIYNRQRERKRGESVLSKIGRIMPSRGETGSRHQTGKNIKCGNLLPPSHHGSIETRYQCLRPKA